MRRLAFAALAGWIAWALITGNDTECKPVVVDTAVQTVCGPVGLDSVRFVSLAALIVVFLSFELSEVEFAGIKVKRLREVEAKVEQVQERTAAIQAALDQTLVALTTSSARAHADGGAAQSILIVTRDSLGRVSDQSVPSATLPDSSFAFASVVFGALTGWWSYFPGPWRDFGCLVLLAPDPIVGLSLVADLGSEELTDVVLAALTGPTGLATQACAQQDPLLTTLSIAELGAHGDVSDIREAVGADSVSFVAVRALSPDRVVVGVVVAVRPGADDSSAADVAAQLEAAADGWALLAPLASDIRTVGDHGQADRQAAQ